MKPSIHRSILAVAGLVLLPGLLSSAHAQVNVADVVSFHAESPHPYPAGHESMPVVWTDEIRSPGATFIRIHFSEFDLAEGDVVTISDAKGGQRHVYTGRGPRGRGEFWAFSVQGETALVTLQSRGEGGRGYTIDRIGEGFLPPDAETAEAICGDDGKRDVACYGPVAKQRTRPVARLLFQMGPFLSACTGWLVRGPNQNTLMTNNHCIASQADVDTLEARFNFQHSTCGGAANDPAFDFAGDAFLITSGPLDYTLLTLLGDPEGAGAGEYIATSLDPVPGSRIVLPQHPGGNQKEVGLFEDAAQTQRCDVTSVNQTYSSYTPGSQFNYACDTEGGSSGSPVIDVSTGHVWGLHHLGTVTILPCTNGATHMSDICADAGALLDCASD